MFRTVLALSSTVLLMVSGATPAGALSSFCHPNHVCMWEHSAYFGSKYVNRLAVSGVFDIGMWDGDNEISSLSNTSNCTITLHDNDSPQSSTRHWVFLPYDDQPDLKVWGANDDAESFTVRC
ncbi:hypothetical protein GCM10022247_70650 [Allokutzneria multivorans]|uniref:Peptidase inhibitor family I36 n=1 Tax=Allokutzneria multivorans TaxID=1142134 RepID=A0ABP7U302_9PSEU